MQHIYSEERQEWLPLYTEGNDLTYKPDKEEPYSLTMWEQRRLNFLKENRNGACQRLMISGLWEHPVQTDKEANRLEDELTEQMSRSEGITEELKKQNMMEWVGLRNNLKERVREIVL